MTDAPEVGPRGTAGRAGPVVGSLAMTAALYALLTLTPQVRLGPPLIASVVATALFIALSVLLVVQLTRISAGPRAEVLVAGLCGAGWWVLGGQAEQPGAARLYLQPADSLLFMGLCVFAGRLLSRIVREQNMLLPVGLVAIIADVFTVAVGPTGKALEQARGLVEKLSVGLPEAGSAAGPEGAAGLAMLASMGLGDFIFLALFFAAAARFGFAWRRGAGLITALVLLAIAGYFALPLVGINLLGIPLLPFIAGGFLLAYRDRFHLSRQEWQGLLWGALLLAVILGALAWVSRG